MSVTKAGDIYVGETKMTFEQFRGAFKALADKKGEGGVYLRADAGAPYGFVVRVLAAMRASGVSDVGLVAEPEEGGGGGA